LISEAGSVRIKEDEGARESENPSPDYSPPEYAASADVAGKAKFFF